jgi:large subunit ribosomal protein L21
MYAIIQTGGKQYRVAQGDVVQIEKLEGDSGSAVRFEQVLLVSDQNDFKVGTPRLDGASVSGTIMEQGRGKKVVIFKFKRCKNYKRSRGHRQYFTRVRIDAISA